MATTRPVTSATSSVVARQPLPVVQSEPERLFRVEPVSEQDAVVSTTMPTGPWAENSRGRISLGALGVLADDVLGYAVLVERPAGHWSVSTEISLDLCHPVESGVCLSGHAQPDFADDLSAVTSGEILDDQGRLVAVGRQHGRFVPGLPAGVDVGKGWDARRLMDQGDDPASILELLDVAPRRADEGAVLALTATQEFVNPLGNLHGGMTLCLTDLVAATAMEEHGPTLETTSIHVAYLRPIALGTTVTFAGSVVHAGRSFAVARVEARDSLDRLCATAVVTAGPRTRS